MSDGERARGREGKEKVGDFKYNLNQL